MLSLDDFDVIERYDKSGMLKLIESFPEQCSRRPLSLWCADEFRAESLFRQL